MPPYLYHGSDTQGITLLEPRHRFIPQGKILYDAIYATPSIAFAAIQSFPWATDEGFNLDVSSEQFIFTAPLQFKGRLHVPVSIYKVSSTDFIHTTEEGTGYTFHITKPVSVLEEIKYESAEAALKELGVQLVYS